MRKQKLIFDYKRTYKLDKKTLCEIEEYLSSINIKRVLPEDKEHDHISRVKMKIFSQTPLNIKRKSSFVERRLRMG